VSDDVEALRARIEALERESRRTFEDAQREADVLFAQYQLSQLIAAGRSLAELARSVTIELVRLAGADGGALWVDDPDEDGLGLVAAVGAVEPAPGQRIAGLTEAQAWADGIPGAHVLVVTDEGPTILLALWPPAGEVLDAEGMRVAQLARHELAVAVGSARLREALDQERHDLNSIVDGATDLILQVDETGRVARLNPAGARLLGVSLEAAIGRPCGEVLGCDAAGGHATEACPLAEVARSREAIGYRELAVRGASGAPIRVGGSFSAGPPDPGHPDARVRTTAILRDISAIRALEELREGFVATVSHELRTPLALIRGYTETLLQLNVDPDQQRAYFERIDEAAGRLVSLVEGILDVTHLQADPLILERAPTSFPALIARLRRDLGPTGQAERVIEIVDPDGALPPLDVDAARIGQVLDNVIGNALKYSGSGPVVVQATPAGMWLEVAVDDEGIGIPEAERELVTEPFHRAWNVRESRMPGTGLGLYLSRRLVEAHGGRLVISDRPDGQAGTRVTFTLPILARAGAVARG
jgi:signal transduction histidine kinase